MAGSNDFTGQNIQDTYQRVLQISHSGQLADGTGSLVEVLDVTASFAVSASHEITKEVTSSYAETASAAENNFNIAGDLNFDGTSPQITANGSTIFTLQPLASQILPAFNLRTGDDEGIKFGVDSDYTIRHGGTTNLLIREGSSTRFTFGVGGHLTASQGVNIKVNNGQFVSPILGADLIHVTSSIVSASTHIETNVLKGGGDDVSLNIVGSITASNTISATGDVSSSATITANKLFAKDTQAGAQISLFDSNDNTIASLARMGSSVSDVIRGRLLLRDGATVASQYTAAGASYINGANSRFAVGTDTPFAELAIVGIISSSGYISTETHITASGNISASGNINTNLFVIDGAKFAAVGNPGTFDIGQAGAASLNLTHVTASGNISASGAITASNFDGTSTGTNTGDVTLTGTPDYITISGQEITRNQIDLGSDVTGVLPSANLDGDTAHLTTTQTFTGDKTFSGALTASQGLRVDQGEISASAGIVANSIRVDSDGMITINSSSVNEKALANNIADGAHSLFVGSGSSSTSTLMYSDTGHTTLQLRAALSSNAQIVFNEDGSARYILGAVGGDNSFQIRNSNFMGGGSQLLRIFSGSDADPGFASAPDCGIVLGPTSSTDPSTGNFHVTASGNISSSGTVISNEANIIGHITASGNISSSGQIEALDYHIAGKNAIDYNQANTRILFGQNNQKVRLRGSEIELGEDATQHVTASGNIKGDGYISSSQFIGEKMLAVTHAWFCQTTGLFGEEHLINGNVNFGWADRAWSDSITKTELISGAGNFASGFDIQKGVPINANLIDVELIGALRTNKAVSSSNDGSGNPRPAGDPGESELNYWLYKGDAPEGDGTQNLTFMASGSSNGKNGFLKHSQYNSVYITGSTGLTIDKGQMLYVFAQSIGPTTGNVRGSYTVSGRTRE